MNKLGNTQADKNYKPSGISKAESRAWEAYPNVKKDGATIVQSFQRFCFQQGYEQAEKDLALTWEDIRTIVQILTKGDWYDFEIADKLWSKEFYEKVLRRFNEGKEKEQ